MFDKKENKIYNIYIVMFVPEVLIKTKGEILCC